MTAVPLGLGELEEDIQILGYIEGDRAPGSLTVELRKITCQKICVLGRGRNVPARVNCTGNHGVYGV